MSSLSSVVSNLVRASMGSTVSNTVTDDDLDRHVAQLILKEAKQKAERYNKDGIRAYLPNGGLPESNAPRTNKRFLSSIIRSTDDHNKVILRTQALAAQEIKREREEMERKDRQRRAEEAVEAERLRRLRRCESDSWDGRDRRYRNKKRKERSRSVDDEDDYRKRIGHDDRDHRRSRRSSRHHRDSKRTRRRRSRPASCKHDSRSPSPTKRESSLLGKRQDGPEGRSRRHSLRSPPLSDPRLNDPNQDPPPRRSKHKHETEDEDASRSRRSRSITRLTPGSESPAPRRQPESDAKAGSSSSRIPISPATHSPSRSPQSTMSQLPSKMDKYFEASYDPRLDVATLSVPSIPASGFIDNAQFEGWDAMLELIRVRREDKEEKKRLEKLGLTKEKLRDKKKNKGDSAGISDRWSDVGVSIMDIEYKKKGAVREWDMGKEGFQI